MRNELEVLNLNQEFSDSELEDYGNTVKELNQEVNWRGSQPIIKEKFVVSFTPTWRDSDIKKNPKYAVLE